MDLKLTEVITVTVTTTAQDVSLNGKRCKIQNTDDTNTVYFKEKSKDGVVATSTNGLAVFAKETTQDTMILETISIIGAGNASIRIAVFTNE